MVEKQNANQWDRNVHETMKDKAVGIIVEGNHNSKCERTALKGQNILFFWVSAREELKKPHDNSRVIGFQCLPSSSYQSCLSSERAMLLFATVSFRRNEESLFMEDKF